MATQRHNLSIYEGVFQRISALATKEKRSVTNMAEILLEDALKNARDEME